MGGALRAVQDAGRFGLADLRSMVRVLREPDVPQAEPGLAEIGALAAVMAGAGLNEASAERHARLTGGMSAP